MYKNTWCMCKFVVLLNKPVAFLKFSLMLPLSLLKLPAKCFGPPWTTDHWTFISMDYTYCSPTTPQKTNKLMTSPDALFTKRLYTIKTKEQRNWSTTFYTNTTTHTSPNLQRHTVTQLNSTHFYWRIHIRHPSFITGGQGWYNVFSQVNFFLPFPNFLQKKL